MEKTLLSAAELAERLGVPITWVYSQTRADRIPFYRLGKYLKFSEREISQWLTEQGSSSREDF